MRPFSRLWSAQAAGLMLLSGCLGACGAFGEPAEPSSLATPPDFEPPGGQSKCNLSASQMRPLIVEWSAADRAALEVLKSRGPVVVRYEGCEMEILPRCRVPGSYRYIATTRKSERVVIQNQDELYANLPVGAVKLEGKLERAGRLDVTMNVVGQYDAEDVSVRRDALEGDCSEATHVVAGLTVGAFAFTAGASASAGGGADVLGAGVGAEKGLQRELLSSDGDVSACETATRTDTAPPPGCGALLRVAVAELTGAEAPAAATQPLSCPQGTSLVDGKCVAAGGLATVAPVEANRLLVRVTCGAGISTNLLGESDGLKVWIDGELTPAVEEERAYNAMSPGAPGLLHFVAYETTPGKHRVRVAADGCEAMESDIRVKPGMPRDVRGRLRPTVWHRRPPASSAGLGFGVGYHLYDFESVTMDDNDYDEISLSPDAMQGFGVDLPISAGYAMVIMGAHWTKGDLPIEAPACEGALAEDCLPAGTKVEGSVSGYHFPLRTGARLPFVYGAAMLGTGIEFNVLSVDVAEAEPNFFAPGSTLGVHVPVWAGLEFRPWCSLAIGAQVSRGFGLFSDVGNYQAASVSASWIAAAGCSDEDFGIQ